MLQLLTLFYVWFLVSNFLHFIKEIMLYLLLLFSWPNLCPNAWIFVFHLLTLCSWSFILGLNKSLVFCLFNYKYFVKFSKSSNQCIQTMTKWSLSLHKPRWILLIIPLQRRFILSIVTSVCPLSVILRREKLPNFKTETLYTSSLYIAVFQCSFFFLAF